MRLLLFGKNGQVARTLLEEAAGVHDVIALGRAEADLSRPGTAAAAIRTHAPDAIINAAAYTAVDKAETEKEAAHTLNALAPEEMAKAAAQAGAPFIHLSTDYVFGGNAAGPYAEDDATNPINVYGATKREGETGVLAENKDAVILRTSWVFSEYGANFVKTMLRLGAERDALDIVGDQIGGPTPARDIARTVLTIAGKKHRGAPGASVYHYQGAPAASWADFAKKIFDYAGLAATVRAIATTDYPTPAKRPLATILDCARIERDFGVAQPDWRIGLRQTVATLTAAGPAP